MRSPRATRSLFQGMFCEICSTQKAKVLRCEAQFALHQEQRSRIERLVRLKCSFTVTAREVRAHQTSANQKDPLH